MEEVDGIIVHTLRTIGCEIGDDVHSLAQFSTDSIVEAVAMCIKVIREDLDLPHRLPPSMSAKFRIGTSLANAVKEIGYSGEVGYQTFLYSNELDIRKVFIFLLEKMPKGSSHGTEEPTGASVLLQTAIANEVGRRLASPWTPSYCKKRGICWRGNPAMWQRQGCSGVQHFNACPIEIPRGMHDITWRTPKEIMKYYTENLPVVTSQAPLSNQTTQAVLENNAIKYTAQQDWEAEWSQYGLLSRLSPQEYKAKKLKKMQSRIASHVSANLKSAEASRKSEFDSLFSADADTDRTKTKRTRFTHIEKLQYGEDEDKILAQVQEVSRETTEEELQQKREEEINALTQDLQEVCSKVEQLQLDMRKYTAGQQQMEEKIGVLEAENEASKESFKVKKRTMDLLPDAENNLHKLQAMVDSSAQRLVTLANQWEQHRAPLIDNYRKMKALNENRETETQKKLEEIKQLREKMKEVASDARSKEELYKQLVLEYERMGKDVNRAAYTKRILEIVGNIKKQKEDIDKVLIDTKSIQKEINQLSGKLDRTFTVTDELIFRDAKKDESVRKAYKFLAALHENCNSVINTVEETGVILREIRDLEDQIEQESKSKVMDNLEKITADYQQMKKENSVLIAKYKKMQET